MVRGFFFALLPEAGVVLMLAEYDFVVQPEMRELLNALTSAMNWLTLP